MLHLATATYIPLVCVLELSLCEDISSIQIQKEVHHLTQTSIQYSACYTGNVFSVCILL